MAGGANDATYWQREAYTSEALLYTPDNHWSFDYSLDYAFNNLNDTAGSVVVPDLEITLIANFLSFKYSNT